MNDPHMTLTRLYETYRVPLLRFLTRLTGTTDAAEDVCHDTFLKVLHAWDRSDPGRDVRAWLYAIARHTAYDYVRGQRLRRTIALDALPPQHLSVAWEESVIDALTLQMGLRHVSPPMRAALLLQAWAGTPVPTLAARFGCSPGTMAVRLHRCRARVRSFVTVH